jgi:hypothetical protein
MPLKAGTSRKTQSANISELMHAFRRTGRIGTSTPASPAKAVKQAVAISYSKQRESK